MSLQIRKLTLIAAVLAVAFLTWQATNSNSADPIGQAFQIDGASRHALSSESISKLIERLGSDSYLEREIAQEQLRQAGAVAVESLRAARNKTTDPELIWRLDLAIDNLLRPRWFVDVQSAQMEARRTGKLLMVFSTIGEINGFS